MATVLFDRSSGLRVDGLGGDVRLKTVNVVRVDGLRIHSTVTESEHESDSSDEESEAGGTANFTSFSCICASRSSTLTSESFVYFDNFSNLNFIKDKAWPWTSKPSP